MKNKRWYDYLYFVSLLYLILGCFNILFAWLGMLCFIVPLVIAIVKGNKAYCNKYCGRGQLLYMLGNNLKLSRKKDIPNWLKSKVFRYGFLIFFLVMFASMLFSTYLVFAGKQELKEIVKVLWTFKLPWHFAYSHSSLPQWVIQYAFGFYSIMLTSTILGLITMILYKPRSWCTYCPMGTMTQSICKLKHHKKSD